MARKKLSEFRAKEIIYTELKLLNTSVKFDFNENSIPDLILDNSKKYVVKVDQGVKKRFKQGLVGLNLSPDQIKEKLEEFNKQGYEKFIIEEFISSDKAKDYYLSIQRVRDGLMLLYSDKGGVDIEEEDNIRRTLVRKESDLVEVKIFLGIEEGILEKIVDSFEEYYFSFLEINPLRVIDEKIFILDCAVEVDASAIFFVEDKWNERDFVEFNSRKKTEEELNIQKLSEESASSFSLEVLNPDGAIFLLLSGGGGSVVLADEVFLEGEASLIANYGEYSGNPNKEETYIYAKNLLLLLLKSRAPKKALIIGGGVANFTDVRVTFKGIINALSEVSSELRAQRVKIFVRRGGPHDKEGLALIRDFLDKENLLGEVFGAEIPLTDIVRPSINYVS